MEGEIVFRHVLPYVLLHSAFSTEIDMNNLDQATPLPVMFLNLLRIYANIDTAAIRGYDMYKDFKNEVDYNQDRITLTCEALLQNGFNVEALIRYIGGPYIGAHRDYAQIRARLTPGVESDLLNRAINVFEYGAPPTSTCLQLQQELYGVLELRQPFLL